MLDGKPSTGAEQDFIDPERHRDFLKENLKLAFPISILRPINSSERFNLKAILESMLSAIAKFQMSDKAVAIFLDLVQTTIEVNKEQRRPTNIALRSDENFETLAKKALQIESQQIEDKIAGVTYTPSRLNELNADRNEVVESISRTLEGVHDSPSLLDPFNTNPLHSRVTPKDLENAERTLQKQGDAKLPPEILDNL